MDRETGVGINPGKLRRPVQIRTYASTWDHGQETRTYAVSDPVGMYMEALSGRELVAAQTVNSEAQFRFTMRYRPALKPNAQLLYAGRTFEVLAILHDEHRHTITEALCKEVNPA